MKRQYGAQCERGHGEADLWMAVLLKAARYGCWLLAGVECSRPDLQWRASSLGAVPKQLVGMGYVHADGPKMQVLLVIMAWAEIADEVQRGEHEYGLKGEGMMSGGCAVVCVLVPFPRRLFQPCSNLSAPVNDAERASINRAATGGSRCHSTSYSEMPCCMRSKKTRTRVVKHDPTYSQRSGCWVKP